MDIGAWLRELGYERYEQAFRDHHIDAQDLSCLTAEDLRELGVTSLHDRRRILQSIAESMRDKHPAFEYEKVKLLFDYTKFHIGLYTTLGTLIVGILNVEFMGDVRLEFCPALLWIAVVCIGIAGLAGGVIASTLPESKSLYCFFERNTGFWGFRRVKGKTWTRIEHTFFWLAVILALLSFAFGQTTPSAHGVTDFNL